MKVGGIVSIDPGKVSGIEDVDVGIPGLVGEEAKGDNYVGA